MNMWDMLNSPDNSMVNLIYYIIHCTVIYHQIVPYVVYYRIIILIPIHYSLKYVIIYYINMWGDEACIQVPN